MLLPMASNAPGQSETLSFAAGAPNFVFGEFVLIRIPESIDYVDDEATAVGTDLPPTSNGSSPHHFAFIRHVERLSANSYVLEVYPVLCSGGALPGYNGLTDVAKATLPPLPPLSFRHPTPDAFGAPLDFGNWSNSFIHVIPKRFAMPTSRPVSLSFDDRY
jgi:hypothetical protein